MTRLDVYFRSGTWMLCSYGIEVVFVCLKLLAWCMVGSAVFYSLGALLRAAYVCARWDAMLAARVFQTGVGRGVPPGSNAWRGVKGKRSFYAEKYDKAHLAEEEPLLSASSRRNT